MCPTRVAPYARGSRRSARAERQGRPGGAHAALDQAEGTDHGWAAQADALHARLVPPGLDPDPLATVERLVAAQKAAEKKAAWHRPGWRC